MEGKKVKVGEQEFTIKKVPPYIFPYLGFILFMVPVTRYLIWPRLAKLFK